MNKIRRRFKDNPYYLDTNDNKYFIIFKDSSGIVRKIEISKDIFDVFNEFELEDIRMMHELERHIDHYEKTEEEIYSRLSYHYEDMDDLIIRKSTYDELISAIGMLPEVQKRRSKMYYFDELDLKSIALLEGTSFQMVSKSIKKGINNLKKILKNDD